MPTKPTQPKSAARKSATSKPGASKVSSAKRSKSSSGDSRETSPKQPTAKNLNAIWISSDAHRQAKIGVSFMIGTGEDKFRNMTLGMLTELAVLDRLEKFYASRGMSVAKITALKAEIKERLQDS